MPYPKVPKATYICATCGESFQRRPRAASQPRTSGRKFCSEACYQEFVRSEEFAELASRKRWEHVDGNYTVVAKIKEVLQ